MDERHRSLMWLLLGLMLGMAFGYWLTHRPKKAPYLLHLEYWVYLPGETMPPQDEVLARLVRPETGRPAISNAEATLFSDVRLHLGLVLRSRNAHTFRPDLMEPRLDATPEELELLGAAKSFVKVRFLSEQPPLDRRYLSFLPQLARAVAALGGSGVIFDVMGERLLRPDELKGGDPGPNILWAPQPTGGQVETKGLRKVGLPEVRTHWIAADERLLVSEVLDGAARELWTMDALPESVDTEAYGDRFRLDLALGRDGVAEARVHRIQRV